MAAATLSPGPSGSGTPDGKSRKRKTGRDSDDEDSQGGSYGHSNEAADKERFARSLTRGRRELDFPLLVTTVWPLALAAGCMMFHSTLTSTQLGIDERSGQQRSKVGGEEDGV